MPRWSLIVFASLLMVAPFQERAPALAQGNSVLIPNEPAGLIQSNGRDSLLESVFWGTDRLSSEEEEFGYEMDSAPYGYPIEEYGFRSEDEYGAQEDGRYGYEMSDDGLIKLQMNP
jgi:hypothetical protein